MEAAGKSMLGEAAASAPRGAFRAAWALIRLDVRQNFRKHLGAKTTRDRLLKAVGLFFGLAFFAGLHVGAWTLVSHTVHAPSGHPAELLRGLGAGLWAFLLFVMLSGGLVRAIVVLHEQDDGSLLLSSPVAPRAVLAGRLFGNALQSCLVDGFIIIPYIDVLVFGEGWWRFLWGFPVWLALAVVVTCLDGLFSFGMIRLFGLRRARMLSQAVPFLLIFGVTFFAGSLSLSIARMNAGGAAAHMPPEMQARFIALAHTPLAWPAEAAAGNLMALGSLIVFTVALAWATLRLTERAFIEGTQNLSENAAISAPPRRDRPFRGNLVLLEMTKGIRLVTRTPMMLVQCLAQVLTPVGIAFVLGGEDPAAATAFFVIFVAGVLGGMFTIAAGTVEEADELLQMAPRPFVIFRLGKMLAGCAVPVALLLVTAVGLFAFGKVLDALAVAAAGLPLALVSSFAGEGFAKPVSPGVRPKLLGDPVMMIPLLGMQTGSGLVAGAVTFAAVCSETFLTLSLIGAYILLALVAVISQWRKPLF